MIYLGKITKINSMEDTFYVDIPSLGTEVMVFCIGLKGVYHGLEVGDLVAVAETNTQNYVILGYVFGQKKKESI